VIIKYVFIFIELFTYFEEKSTARSIISMSDFFTQFKKKRGLVLNSLSISITYINGKVVALDTVK